MIISIVANVMIIKKNREEKLVYVDKKLLLCGAIRNLWQNEWSVNIASKTF